MDDRPQHLPMFRPTRAPGQNVPTTFESSFSIPETLPKLSDPTLELQAFSRQQAERYAAPREDLVSSRPQTQPVSTYVSALTASDIALPSAQYVNAATAGARQMQADANIAQERAERGATEALLARVAKLEGDLLAERLSRDALRGRIEETERAVSINKSSDEKLDRHIQRFEESEKGRLAAEETLRALHGSNTCLTRLLIATAILLLLTIIGFLIYIGVGAVPLGKSHGETQQRVTHLENVTSNIDFSKINELSNDVQMLKTKTATLVSRVDGLDTLTGNMSSRIDDISSKNGILHNNISELSNNFAVYSHLVNATIQSIDSDFTVLTNRTTALNDGLEALNASTREIKNELSSTNANVHNLTAQLGQTNVEMTQLVGNVTLLTKELSDLDNRTLALEDTLDTTDVPVRLEQLEVRFNATRICETNPCANGECAAQLFGYTCLCYSGYQGTNCTEEIESQETESSNATIEWGSPSAYTASITDNLFGWKIYVETNASFWKTHVFKTLDNKVNITELEPNTAYDVAIWGIGFNHKYTQLVNEPMKFGNDGVITWPVPSRGAGNGYLVKITLPARRLVAVLEPEMTRYTATDLLAGSAYKMAVWAVNTAGTETHHRSFIIIITNIVENTYLPGSSVIFGQWSGGQSLALDNSFCNIPHTNVTTSWPQTVRSCCDNDDEDDCKGEMDNSVITVGEVVVQDDQCRIGDQCWHYVRGNAGNYSYKGIPHSAPLPVYAGRLHYNVQGGHNYARGAHGDWFQATFWIRAANISGDGSILDISPSNSMSVEEHFVTLRLIANVGNSSTSVFANVNEKCFSTGLEWVCKVCKPSSVVQSWQYLGELMAIGNNKTEWHNITLTGYFEDNAILETWTIYLNGEEKTKACSLKLFRPDVDASVIIENFLVNRLRFRSGDDSNDVTKAGFLIDDIKYSVYNLERNETVADYFTSFEAPTNIL